jgi:IS30 family transposase
MKSTTAINRQLSRMEKKINKMIKRDSIARKEYEAMKKKLKKRK